MIAQKFDIIIAGGGIAGLTLAHFLTVQESTKNLKVLVIDQGIEIEFANVSFWAKSLPIADMPLVGSWRQFEVVFPKLYRLLLLHEYAFYSFNRADHLSFLKKELAQKKVSFHTESIETISGGGKRALVVTKSGKQFEANWVFDSTHLGEGKVKATPVQGWTWEIETSKPVFAPETMTLFDFEATKLPDSFLYILPLSASKAIIEFSSFAAAPSIGACEYWLTNRLKSTDYKMVRLNQKGTSTYRASKVPKDSRIIPIGLKAGIMSLNSGFAYMNIVRHCQYMAKHFPNYSSFTRRQGSWYRSLLDHLFTTIFTRLPSVGARLLPLLFVHSQGDAVLAYLEGTLPLKHMIRPPFAGKSQKNCFDREWF